MTNLKDMIRSGISFEIVDKINSADKASGIVTTASLGGSTLGIEKLAQFIQTVRHKTTILQDATFKRITKDALDIDLIEMARGVMRPGVVGGAKVAPTQTGISTITNRIIPHEYVASVNIDIEALEDNIEQDALERKIVTMLGTAVRTDIEGAMLFGHTGFIPPATNPTNTDLNVAAADGWLRRIPAANRVFGFIAGTGVPTAVGAPTTAHFNPAATNYPINMFDAMINAMPPEFRDNIENLKFYVPFAVRKAYKNIIASRQTIVGDAALLGKQILTYDDIPVIHAPVLDYPEFVARRGSNALLVDPANLYWGMKRNISVRSQEDIDWRRIRHVLTHRTGNHFEDARAAINARISTPTLANGV